MRKHENNNEITYHLDNGNLLHESNDDIKNLIRHLGQPVPKLSLNLESLSKDLECKIANLEKILKADRKPELISLYHYHKQVADKHLKGTNKVIRRTLDLTKRKLNELEKRSEGEQKKAVHKLYGQVVGAASDYNHKHSVLKVKLELEQAEVSSYASYIVLKCKTRKLRQGIIQSLGQCF